MLDIGANTFSNSPSTHPEFAFPSIRTAFYAQTGSQFYDQKNGLWRQSLVQEESEKDKKDDVSSETAVKSPPEGQIGTDVYAKAMDATDGIAGSRAKSAPPSSFAVKKKKVSPISPENYDPWVYRFSRDNMPPYPQWQTMDDGPPVSTAQVEGEQAPSEAIIGGEKMDEEVHDFVSKNTNGLHQKKHHKHRKSHSLAQHKKSHKAKAKDMAERGMDEEVYGFASTIVSGINAQERSATPYDYNGGLSGWSLS